MGDPEEPNAVADMGDPDEPNAVANMETGLARSRGGFMSRLRGFLGGSAFADDDWEKAEDALIAGDIGAGLAARIVATARGRRDATTPGIAIRAALAGLLAPRDPNWDLRAAASGHPAIILVVGVNGTGKTTTIGKLAVLETDAGQRVVLAAADTFRAAALEQLRAWADRSGADLVGHAPGADPGAVVFDAIDAGVARGADLVIIDTAGRLHTKSSLMDELSKIRRVIDRRLPGAQPETFFVLDATSGQNGLSQALAFNAAVGLTGIVLTKLDSTARGGIVFAIEDQLGVPVRFVGVGEGPRDLIPFDPDTFIASLYGSPEG